jgi:hypothetical protein
MFDPNDIPFWTTAPQDRRNLIDQVCDWDNLMQAFTRASKGKRGLLPAAQFEYNLADNLLALQTGLRDGTWRPGAYHSFYIHEPKRRLISAAPFRDRVAHHALCNVTVPYFERLFLPDSYANQVGKGTHRALDRCQQFARRFKYVLPCDVVQFFPSIDHAILSQTLQAMLPPDEGVMRMIDLILESGRGVLSEQYDMVYFDGDDLFALNRPRGLPIGNLTSQWWANCYMNPFDQFVKRSLGCKGYLRYVDDMLLFGDDKAELWAWREAILARLARLRLTMHVERAHPQPVTEGIPFLGFTVFPTHRRLKRRKGIAFQRKLKRLAATADRTSIRASVQGWINHVRYGDTFGLRRAMLAGRGLLAFDDHDEHEHEPTQKAATRGDGHLHAHV